MQSFLSTKAGWKLLVGVFLLPLLAVPPAPADQYAVMSSGCRLRIEKYQSTGPVTKLFLPGGGEAQVSTTDIVRFEADEYVPPLPRQEATAPELDQTGPDPTDLDNIVKDTGERHRLDPDLIRSIIAAESAGNPQAVSPKGAKGLMQLMPKTARLFHVSDIFDPVQNVEAGTSYLHTLLSRYDNNLHLALAAYNAGPNKVDAYGGVPPYRETQNYIRRIINSYNRKKLSPDE
jgi:soluble lytic murein transglycosylase-like protein